MASDGSATAQLVRFDRLMKGHLKRIHHRSAMRGWFSLLVLIFGMADACGRSSEPSGSSNPAAFRAFLISGRLEPVDPPASRIRSKPKALLFSLVLPGSGEYYAGSKTSAAVFLGIEAVLWAGCIWMDRTSEWKKQDFRLFAAAHAGADPSGKDDRFFVNLENYRSLIEYNDAKLKQRDLAALYPEDRAHFWEWDSEASRRRFEGLRLSSDRAHHGFLLFVGGMVLNRLASGIDAVRAVKNRANARVDAVPLPQGGAAVRVSFNPFGP